MGVKEHVICVHCGAPRPGVAGLCPHCGKPAVAEAELPLALAATVDVRIRPKTGAAENAAPDLKPKVNASTPAAGTAVRPARPRKSAALPAGGAKPAPVPAPARPLTGVPANLRPPSSLDEGLMSREPVNAETRDGLPAGVPSKINTGLGRPVEIGGCEVLNEIARGGMGVVYRARQIKLDRIVALKVMIAGENASEGQVKRFLAEARAAARLKHPNIVPIFEVGEEGGRHFFTMEFIEGQPLSALIAKKPLNAAQVVALLEPVAEAVHYAHTQGIIHRDLKPANILIDERSQPRVADFGLARDVSGASSLSQTGHLVGTPAYLSPEQAQGQELDPRSDVYALGVVMFEMLTGKPPFEAPNLPALLTKIVMDDAPLLETFLPNIDGDMRTIVMTCLEKDRQRRYRSAAALAADLRRFRAGEPIAARPASLGYRLARQARKHRGVLAGFLMALVAGLAAVGVWWQVETQRAAAEAQRQNAETQRLKAEADKAQAEAQARLLLERNQELVQQSETRWETVFEDDFKGEVLNPRWQPVEGTWFLTGGMAKGKPSADLKNPECTLVLNQSIGGDVKVTLRAMSLKTGSSELALCVLTSLEKPGYDGYFLSIKPTGLRVARENVTLFASENMQLTPEQPMVLMFSREGEHLRLQIDDSPVIELEDWTPPHQANRSLVAVYAWNSTLCLTDIKVEQRALPQKAGVLEMAEYQRARGKLTAALEATELFLQKGSEKGAGREAAKIERALQLKALCLEDLDQGPQALAAWRTLAQEFHSQDNVFRDAAARIRGREPIADVMAALEAEFPKSDAWAELLPAILGSMYDRQGKLAADLAAIEELLELADRCLWRIHSIPVQERAKGVIAQTAESLCYISPIGMNNDQRVGLMRRSLKYRPDSSMAWSYLAGLYQAMNRNEDALDALQRYAALQPKSDRAHYSLARAYLGLNRHADAIAEAKATIVLNPNHAWVLEVWANALVVADHPREAIEKYKAAVAIEPGFADAWMNMAITYFNLQAYDEAAASAQRATEVEPNNGRLWGTRGKLLMQSGERAKALEAFEQARKLEPKNAQFQQMAAILLFEVDRYPEAQAALVTAGADRSNDFSARHFYGLTQWALEDYAGAEATTQLLIKLRPELSPGYGLQAVCLAHQKKTAEAWAALEVANLRANDPQAKAFVELYRGEMLVIEDKPAEALKAYRKGRAFMAEDPWMQRQFKRRIDAILDANPALKAPQAPPDEPDP